MNVGTRHSAILELLRAQGRVGVEALAHRFDVTTQTIRQDLRQLSDQGLARRTHGGAMRIGATSNREYADRRTRHGARKQQIGHRAAGLIPNNCSVALNIGTTTEHVAQALMGHDGLVVISNNLNIITTLMGGSCRELVVMGGSVRQSDGAITGRDALDVIARYKVDFAVIGASALDDEGAVLDFDAREVDVARAILANARTRVLVCDSSKFETTAPVRICDVAELDYVSTDAPPPPGFAEAATAAETRILLPDPVKEPTP